jgi:O-methyltransferase involved in polyketide biosynthesis
MPDAPLFRAQLTAALRRLPSELPGVVAGVACSGPVPSEADALAAQLEMISPGLALLMQLRARMFAHVESSAGCRGLEQVVMVGRGYAVAEGHGRCPGIPVVEIEQPSVVAALGGSRADGIDRAVLAVDDLQEGAWVALHRSTWSPRFRRTLFLIEGVSMWGGETGWSFWIRALAHEAAAGSEMLLNVLDVQGAEQARVALQASSSGAGTLVAPTAVHTQALRAAADDHALEIVRMFDSDDVQQAEMGFADLLVRERYIWVRSPGAPRDVPTPRPLPFRRPAVPANRDIPRRPRLRDGLTTSLLPSGQGMLGLAITPRRVCRIPLGSTDLAAAAGDADLMSDDLAWRLQAAGLLSYDRDGSTFDVRVDALCRRLRLVPHEVCAGARCRLDVLRRLMFAALSTKDSDTREGVSGLLAVTSNNVASELVRRLLADPDVVCVQDGEIAVALRPMTVREVDTALRPIRDALEAIGELLQVPVAVPLLVDLTSRRPGIPVALVGDAAPCTVVRIAPSEWSPAALHHELTHVLAMCGSRWVSEGLAVWTQRRLVPGVMFPAPAPFEPALEWRSLSEALSGAGLEGMPGARRLGAEDYAAAGEYVGWLIERYGFEVFARIFDACWAGVRGPVDAVCRELGLASLDELEADWRRGSL